MHIEHRRARIYDFTIEGFGNVFGNSSATTLINFTQLTHLPSLTLADNSHKYLTRRIPCHSIRGFADLIEEVLALIEMHMAAVDISDECEIVDQVRRRTTRMT